MLCVALAALPAMLVTGRLADVFGRLPAAHWAERAIGDARA